MDQAIDTHLSKKQNNITSASSSVDQDGPNVKDPCGTMPTLIMELWIGRLYLKLGNRKYVCSYTTWKGANDAWDNNTCNLVII